MIWHQQATGLQHISDTRKNNDKILKFTDNIETCEGLKRKSLKLAKEEMGPWVGTGLAHLVYSAEVKWNTNFKLAASLGASSSRKLQSNWLVRQIKKSARHKEPSYRCVCSIKLK